MYLHSLFRISMPACDMEPLDKGGYLQTVLPFSRSPFYQIGSIKTEVHAIFSYMPCINYVLIVVTSFWAYSDDQYDRFTRFWCWCPWLLSNGPRRRRWSLACLDRLEWIHRHHQDHNQVAKLSSPLCTIATLSCQDWRFSNINSFTCTKLARPWI